MPVKSQILNMAIEKSETVSLPTEHGPFKLLCYTDSTTSKDHLVLLHGDYLSASAPLIRIHSECATGDIFGSLKCDCGPQLDNAMSAIVKEGVGLIIYLKQEGRDIGIRNKIKAYALQDQGRNTIDANTELGFDADQRTYEIAAYILHDLGIDSVQLMTNNPAKVNGLTQHNITVTKRCPIEVKPNPHNVDYLTVKKEAMNHQLQLTRD